MEHISKRPRSIKEELRPKQSSGAKRRAEGTEILAPNYMSTENRGPKGVPGGPGRVRTGSRSEEGMGAHLRGGLVVKGGGWN